MLVGWTSTFVNAVELGTSVDTHRQLLSLFVPVFPWLQLILVLVWLRTSSQGELELWVSMTYLRQIYTTFPIHSWSREYHKFPHYLYSSLHLLTSISHHVISVKCQLYLQKQWLSFLLALPWTQNTQSDQAGGIDKRDSCISSEKNVFLLGSKT